MPFLSYHISTEESIKNAGRLIKEENAHCVKLESSSDIRQGDGTLSYVYKLDIVNKKI